MKKKRKRRITLPRSCKLLHTAISELLHCSMGQFMCLLMGPTSCLLCASSLRQWCSMGGIGCDSCVPCIMCLYNLELSCGLVLPVGVLVMQLRCRGAPAPFVLLLSLLNLQEYPCAVALSIWFLALLQGKLHCVKLAALRWWPCSSAVLVVKCYTPQPHCFCCVLASAAAPGCPWPRCWCSSWPTRRPPRPPH